MVNAPCNTLLVGQKDDATERWMETRFIPSVLKNKELAHLLPGAKGNERHKIRKKTLIFNHGFYLEAGGSSESNLQEKSMPLVVFDEAWKTADHPGRIQQAKQRTHDKWNAMILFAGQACRTHYDVEKDDSLNDLYREWLKTDQRIFSWECPHCQTVQEFKWDHVRFEKIELEGYGIDWPATDATVRMACANQQCGAQFEDTVKERRKLAESGRYVVTNPNAPKEFVGFKANSLCYWRVPWSKLVRQFIEANEARYRGDTSLLEVFVTQRLCDFWTPGAHEEAKELESGSYSVSDYEGGKLIDHESCRAMAIDVQQNEMWFTIAAMSQGVLQVLNCGQLGTFEELESMRKAYQVKPKHVLVDSQYRQDYVFQTCAKHGWTAYAGVARDSFTERTPTGENKVPYSEPIPVRSGNGAKTWVINFCVNPIKDVIAELRAGRMGQILIPHDIDPRYQDHLNAEVKRTVISGRENKAVEMWVRMGKRDNHMLDNTMALVGLMMIRKLVGEK